MRKISRITAIVLSLLLMLSVTGCKASDGKTHLTFQIWDVCQRPGMQAMCDAYTAQHPDVVIEVQATSWNEYWTKLEAAAESNTLPDIFWMHTNQLLYYADFGMLADVTDLYDDVDADYYEKHFSEISRSNASGSDGKLYGVPKDKDNGHLVYNKEMFDAAGVEYPNEDWTWDDLVSASEKIYKSTGKYGFMAYNDDQLGYWPFVYQAGGYILNDEKTAAGYTQPASVKGIEFYVGMQDYDWWPCPDLFHGNDACHSLFLGGRRHVYGGKLESAAVNGELSGNARQMGHREAAEMPGSHERGRPGNHVQRPVLFHRRPRKTIGGGPGYDQVLPLLP